MIPGVRLVVLGKQGAGKGTQCVRLSHHYVVPHVSTGDMLRSEVKSRSPLGQRGPARSWSRASSSPTRWSWRWWGAGSPSATPRGAASCSTAARARRCRRSRSRRSCEPFGLDMVIDLQVPTNLVMKRLASRRVCVDCGANYSTAAPPLVNWTCDVCGGEVVQREDDTEEAIERRLNLYEEETAPAAGLVQGAQPAGRDQRHGSPDAVTRRVVGAIDALRQQMKGRVRTSEAQRRRAGQDAPCRQGRGRDARGDPRRCQARA